MPLPIPFYLRLNQTNALTHGELDGNLRILSQKIDNTVGQNIGSSGVGLYINKNVNPNDGFLNFRTLAGGGGVKVFVSGDSIMITGHTAPEIDINVTGGTYNPVNGCATFTTNSGNTFEVCGFLTGYTDSFTDAATLSGTSITFDNTTEGPNFYRVDLWPLLSGFTTDACCYWTAGTGTNAVKLINNSGTAAGDYAVSEGSQTEALGFYSHAEGSQTIASGVGSHSEGRRTIASGHTSHAEGSGTTAGGDYSHTQGVHTTALGVAAHAEGDKTTSSGWGSHSQGARTISSGDYSHAGGRGATFPLGPFMPNPGAVIASGRTSFVHFEQSEHPSNLPPFSPYRYVGAFGDNSAILGGLDHVTLSSATRSVILGGDSILAISADTVYVPRLNIGMPLITTPISNLGIDIEGFVTTATTSGSGFDWCDPYVMSGNTSGCCIDHLFVTRLSGCSPIYIGGPNRIEATGGTCIFPPYPLGSPPGQYFSGGTLGQGNVNVEGVLNIRNYNNRYPAVNIDLEPTYNPHTQYVLTWNTRPCKIGGTRGDVEYVTKPKFWQYWGRPFGVIEMGTTDTDELTQRYGSTSAITIHVTSAGTAQQVFKNVEPNKGREVKIWIPEESGQIGNPWYANMGIRIQAWSGATTATTQLSSNRISTTGIITANVLSATTIILDGISLSACCGVDPYYTSATGPAFTWDVSGQSTNYEITLIANSDINLTNVRNGDYGTIIVHQDGTGGRTINFNNINGVAGTHYVVNGGGGAPTLTATASATDILSFTYNGNAAFWTVGNDYT